MIVTVALLALYEFQSTRPLRGATRSPSIISKVRILFQSTHPLRGATVRHFYMREIGQISIHAPLAGCDSNRAFPAARPANFNPRPPCGVRPFAMPLISVRAGFQSTRPLRGATLISDTGQVYTFISIHAPLAGCDAYGWQRPSHGSISIHAPLAGCDSTRGVFPSTIWISIHAPLAGCDFLLLAMALRQQDFNPRTPCGVRPAPGPGLFGMGGFQSTHPLRGATGVGYRPVCGNRFQSTHPLRGATRLDRSGVAGDRDFNPRTPCGVRRGSTDQALQVIEISIHAPLAGCDRFNGRAARAVDISIHAPLAGCDSKNVQRKLRFFELADKLSARIAAKKPSAKADRCA